MSSNFSFSTVGSELEATLKANVPSTWLVAHASKAQGKITKVALTWEQHDIDSKQAGSDLPNGWAGILFSLILSVPETDFIKSNERAMRELPHLLQLLDSHSQLYWESAEQLRLDTGELAFLIPISVLASYLPKD